MHSNVNVNESNTTRDPTSFNNNHAVVTTRSSSSSSVPSSEGGVIIMQQNNTNTTNTNSSSRGSKVGNVDMSLFGGGTVRSPLKSSTTTTTKVVGRSTVTDNTTTTTERPPSTTLEHKEKLHDEDQQQQQSFDKDIEDFTNMRKEGSTTTTTTLSSSIQQTPEVKKSKKIYRFQVPSIGALPDVVKMSKKPGSSSNSTTSTSTTSFNQLCNSFHNNSSSGLLDSPTKVKVKYVRKVVTPATTTTTSSQPVSCPTTPTTTTSKSSSNISIKPYMISSRSSSTTTATTPSLTMATTATEPESPNTPVRKFRMPRRSTIGGSSASNEIKAVAAAPATPKKEKKKIKSSTTKKSELDDSSTISSSSSKPKKTKMARRSTIGTGSCDFKPADDDGAATPSSPRKSKSSKKEEKKKSKSSSSKKGSDSSTTSPKPKKIKMPRRRTIGGGVTTSTSSTSDVVEEKETTSNVHSDCSTISCDSQSSDEEKMSSFVTPKSSNKLKVSSSKSNSNSTSGLKNNLKRFENIFSSSSSGKIDSAAPASCPSKLSRSFHASPSRKMQDRISSLTCPISSPVKKPKEDNFVKYRDDYKDDDNNNMTNKNNHATTTTKRDKVPLEDDDNDDDDSAIHQKIVRSPTRTSRAPTTVSNFLKENKTKLEGLDENEPLLSPKAQQQRLNVSSILRNAVEEEDTRRSSGDEWDTWHSKTTSSHKRTDSLTKRDNTPREGGGLLSMSSHPCRDIQHSAEVLKSKKKKDKTKKKKDKVKKEKGKEEKSPTKDKKEKKSIVKEFFIPAVQDLKLHKILGEGQFGQVWLSSFDDGKEKDEKTAALVKKPKKQKAYALKILSKFDLIQNDGIETCKQETKVLMKIRYQHPSVMNLVAVIQDENLIYLMQEFAQGGELFSLLHNHRDPLTGTGGIPEKQACFYAACLTDALCFLHSKHKIVYRDLKPENVMLNKYGYPVIIDFGYAKELTEEDNMRTYTLVGTPRYVSPELILSLGYDFGTDNWSLGVLIYELLTGFNPWEGPLLSEQDGLDETELFHVVAEEEFLPIPDAAKLTKEAKDLVSSLLVKEPTLRMGANDTGEILDHEWFFLHKIDFHSLRRRKLAAPWVPEIEGYLDTRHFDDWDHLANNQETCVIKTTYPPLTAREAKLFKDFDAR